MLTFTHPASLRANPAIPIPTSLPPLPARPPACPPAAEGEFKHKIVQRGAVPPLIEMLANDDSQLREMAAFALGRLAQNADNQAGIVAQGGLPPLLDLLETCQSNLQVRVWVCAGGAGWGGVEGRVKGCDRLGRR